MEIIEIGIEEYRQLNANYFLQFDSADFNELNTSKCREVLYLLFKEGGKNRFALICGISENKVMKIPFSAPHTCFTPLQNNLKAYSYHSCIKSLIAYAKGKNLKGIYLTLPPKFYNQSHISNFENALFVNGFRIDHINLNQQYYLENFNESYIANLDIKARQKLLFSLKKNLTFSKIDNKEDIKSVYEIIAINRRENNRPLHVSLEDILKVSKIIDVDFFLVSASEAKIASAIVYRISNRIVNFVYWGGIRESESLKTMNFLSYKLFEYYKNNGFEIIDLGISTNYSIPNFGLCDFKQSVGCSASTKYSFVIDFS